MNHIPSYIKTSSHIGISSYYLLNILMTIVCLTVYVTYTNHMHILAIYRIFTATNIFIYGGNIMSDYIPIPLSKLPIGKVGKVEIINSKGNKRRRLLDLGFIQGSYVLPIRKSPLGDLVAYKIRGTIIALRQEEASDILVYRT